MARARASDTAPYTHVEVVAVHDDAGNTVGVRLLREGSTVGLSLAGQGDRPLVVLTEEDRGALVHPCEVEARVEVVRAGRSIAEERDRNDRVLASLGRHRRAHGLRDLSPDRARGHHKVHFAKTKVVRHLPALDQVVGISEKLIENGSKRNPPGQGDRQLAIGGKDPVLGGKGAARPDLRSLLSHQRRVKTDTALTLQRQATLVRGSSQDHEPVRVQQAVLRKGGATPGRWRHCQRTPVDHDVR